MPSSPKSHLCFALSLVILVAAAAPFHPDASDEDEWAESSPAGRITRANSFTLSYTGYGANKLGSGRNFAIWSPKLDTEVVVTGEADSTLTGSNMYIERTTGQWLSWSNVDSGQISGRKWAVWSGKRDTPMTFVVDKGHSYISAMIGSTRYYLSWTGNTQRYPVAPRQFATWSTKMDTPIEGLDVGGGVSRGVTLTGFWDFKGRLSPGSSQTLELTSSITTTDNKAGSQTDAKSLTVSTTTTLKVSASPPAAIGGPSSEFSQSFSASNTESRSVTSSWNTAVTRTGSASCKLNIPEVKEPMTAWMWTVNGAGGSVNSLNANDCLQGSLQLLPPSCDNSNNQCRPQCAPQGCSDGYCQACLNGFTNLRTGKVTGV